MTGFCSPRPLVVLLVAAGVLTPTALASAGERPHAVRGTAQFVSPTDFVGSGQATHLGLYTEAGSASFSPTADPTVLRIDGWTVLTAADGDELHETVTGYLNLVTGALTGTITIVGGTGRFDDASGSATLSGQLLPDGTISVAVEGTIDY